MLEELEKLGLSHYESKALNVLLKEKFNLRELSKKAEVPFGKIYSVIKSLKEKGLVKETDSRPKLIYVENASEIIGRLIKEKQDKEKEINEKLREIVTEIDKERQRETKFFEIGISREDRRRLQLRIFNEAEEKILQILNIYHNPNINRQNKIEYEKAHENARKRGVVTKAIYPRKVELPSILKNLNKKFPDKFQVKRFDTDFARCDIVDGKKVLVKLAQKDLVSSGGVLFIENEKLAESLIKIFNQMWEEAE